ncbi:MAG: type II secretion system protein [Verrucomicrobiota bacterium]
MKSSKQNAFTLIELLVVISIIAILAGIALPVFGEVQVRGAQTKALSNAKQIGLACKLFASDYSGNYPLYTGELSSPTKTPATPGSTSNSVLQTLMPDYLPDRSIFVIPKSAYCNKAGLGSSATPYVLGAGQNEWAYVLGLTDTSNSRFPLLADGFAKGTS